MKNNTKGEIIDLISFIGECDRKQIISLIDKSKSSVFDEMKKLKKEEKVKFKSFNGTKEEKYSLSGKSMIVEHKKHYDLKVDTPKTHFCVNKLIEYKEIYEENLGSKYYSDFLLENTYLNFFELAPNKNFPNADLVFYMENNNVIAFYTFTYLTNYVEEDVKRYKNLLNEIIQYKEELLKEGKELVYISEYDCSNKRHLAIFENELEKI